MTPLNGGSAAVAGLSFTLTRLVVPHNALWYKGLNRLLTKLIGYTSFKRKKCNDGLVSQLLLVAMPPWHKHMR